MHQQVVSRQVVDLFVAALLTELGDDVTKAELRDLAAQARPLMSVAEGLRGNCDYLCHAFSRLGDKGLLVVEAITSAILHNMEDAAKAFGTPLIRDFWLNYGVAEDDIGRYDANGFNAEDYSRLDVLDTLIAL